MGTLSGSLLKSENAKMNMELLGLMDNEPNIKIEELHSIKMPTLVIAGQKDMIKEFIIHINNSFFRKTNGTINI